MTSVSRTWAGVALAFSLFSGTGYAAPGNGAGLDMLSESLRDDLEAALDEAAQAQETPQSDRAAACHLAYVQSYEAAARESWPYTPQISPGACTDRGGKPVRVVCTPAGRWASLIHQMTTSPLHTPSKETRQDSSIEYSCRAQPF
ncbi:MAG TPA: hypothetical protein PKX87_02020 [Alphaproteobacteria bacterium]|nr:hypothetical protein [Alphaproteobacteria bacterium]